MIGWPVCSLVQGGDGLHSPADAVAVGEDHLVTDLELMRPSPVEGPH